MATILGARVAGLDKETGSLEIGKRADLITVRLDRPHAVPLYNVYSQIVYALKGSDVQDVIVNGKRVTIPSYRVRKGDVISLKPKSRDLIVVRHNMDTLDRRVPPWLETGAEGTEVTVRDLPMREHIDVPVRESLIVELYSK